MEKREKYFGRKQIPYIKFVEYQIIISFSFSISSTSREIIDTDGMPLAAGCGNLYILLIHQ
jgi:hypothetical protein